jgi:hypothetical protein
MHQLLMDLRNNELTRNCFAFGDKHHVSMDNEQWTMDNGATIKSKIQTLLKEKGNTNVSLYEIEPSVEDCFMQLSQK